jgi:hypothetical protein
MRGLLGYLRVHRWQRRALTTLIASILGATVGIVLYSRSVQEGIIRDLGSDSTATRVDAMTRAHALAHQSPRMLRRLERALGDPSDRRFLSVASVLKRLDAFSTPAREGATIDRLRCLEFVAAREARVRHLTIVELLRDGRDNAFVRRALEAGSRDESPAVRELASMLASRLGDTQTLQRLSADSDPRVTSGAWLSKAATGQLAGLAPPATPDSLPPEIALAIAHAMATTHAPQAADFIATAFEDTRLGAFREALILDAATLATDEARNLVSAHLDQARRAGRYPLPLSLPAAAHLGVPVETDIRDTLRGERKQGELLEAHLLAALGAARTLELHVEAEALAICRKLWAPDVPLTLVAAIEAMEQPGSAEVPTGADPGEIDRFLRQAASLPPPTPSSQGSGLPLPSSAAAVALWMRGNDGAQDLLRNWLDCDAPEAMDYIVWRLALRADPKQAFALGQRLLPPSGGPAPERIYSDRLRAAGAMLLALSARNVEQRLWARERIRSRLEGGDAGDEDDAVTAGTFRCALLILGDRRQLPRVRALSGDAESFPSQRAWAALLAFGDRDALDTILLAFDTSDEAIAALMISQGLGEVLATCAPKLPRVDAAANDEVRHIQVRILRHVWGVRRAEVELGYRR